MKKGILKAAVFGLLVSGVLSGCSGRIVPPPPPPPPPAEAVPKIYAELNMQAVKLTDASRTNQAAFRQAASDEMYR